MHPALSQLTALPLSERPPYCKVDVLKQRGGADDAPDTWALDDISCHAPAALQHTETDRHGRYKRGLAGLHAEQHPAVEEMGDSAWESVHGEKHIKHWTGSSGSTMTYGTTFVKHVGDQLFSSAAM